MNKYKEIEEQRNKIFFNEKYNSYEAHKLMKMLHPSTLDSLRAINFYSDDYNIYQDMKFFVNALSVSTLIQRLFNALMDRNYPPINFVELIVVKNYVFFDSSVFNSIPNKNGIFSIPLNVVLISNLAHEHLIKINNVTY